MKCKINWHSIGKFRSVRVFISILFYHSHKKHCVKSVRIRSYAGPHFPAFGLITERYFVSLRIQSECEKIWTRITPNTDTFNALKRMTIPYDYAFTYIELLVCWLLGEGSWPANLSKGLKVEITLKIQITFLSFMDEQVKLQWLRWNFIINNYKSIKCCYFLNHFGEISKQ